MVIPDDDMTFDEMMVRSRDVVAKLRENGFAAESEDWRQVMCVVEEAGEFLAAWRRYSGNARRSGTFEEMSEELADVLITVFIAAEMLNIDIENEVKYKMNKVYTRGWREDSSAIPGNV